jgi:hypothetical protein
MTQQSLDRLIEDNTIKLVYLRIATNVIGLVKGSTLLHLIRYNDDFIVNHKEDLTIDMDWEKF